MYERSAVVLERYFAESFYYGQRANLISNSENYRKLIEVLEKYQEVSEAEDKIIKECEDIASQIKQIQKNQGSLYRKIIKLQEDRNSIFEEIDESSVELGKQLDRIEKEIDKSNSKMRPIDQEFIDTIAIFNEKSDIRSECGKKRRKIEKQYRMILEETTQTIKDIDTRKIKDIKNNVKIDDDNIKEELSTIMQKNGEKEKEPFDNGVIENSIIFGEQIYKQEASTYLEVYDKTNSLLNEINNNAVKIKKYKKLSKDAKNKVDFLSVQKEYLTQFLDNERLSIGLGNNEHKKLMKEACEDFIEDTEQINNLNNLLLDEISGDITSKKYDELYKDEYLRDLQKKDIEFEQKLKKLNLVGKILNPNSWRIISIEKIYSIFNEIVTNEYERDLSRYKIEEEPIDNNDEDYLDNDDEIIEEEKPKKSKTKNNKKQKSKKIDIDIEPETDHDLMDYYDNLDEESEIDIQDDDEDEDDNFEGIYTNFKKDVKDDEEDNDRYSDDDEDDFEENFYRTFYNDDDDFDDEEDNDVYEDLETILKNRRKRASRAKGRKTRNTRKKGIFGLGNKKW